MNHRPPPDLDAFETALLTELKAVVSRSTAPAPPEAPPAPPGGLPPRHRARWYVSLGATAAATLAVALLVPGLRPEPAYAVSGGNNGKVKVEVNRLEGADDLERALQEHGIPADVTYLPPDKACAPGRYIAVAAHGLTLGVSAERFDVTIPPGTVGKGDTFVLSAAVVPIPNGFRASVDFDIAHGPVAPCRVVDAP